MCLLLYTYDISLLYYWISAISLYIYLLYLHSHFIPKITRIIIIFPNTGTWLVDNTTYFHMIGTRELFDTFIYNGSNLCVEVCMGFKDGVKGYGTISFPLDSEEMLRVSNVLWVPKCRGIFLSFSKIERKGYPILFHYVLFVPRRYSFISTMIIGVREGNLYRLRGHPMSVVDS
jgi:hypothetical protein